MWLMAVNEGFTPNKEAKCIDDGLIGVLTARVIPSTLFELERTHSLVLFGFLFNVADFLCNSLQGLLVV